MRYRLDNTEGFTIQELDTLNQVHEILEREFPDVRRNNIADIIKNEWVEDPAENSADKLIKRVRARLG